MKLAVLLVVALSAGIAHADSPPPPRQGRQLEQLLVQRFDRDGDGRLEGRERAQAVRALHRLANRLERKQNRRQRLIQRFDRDGDGNLGPGELPPRIQNRLRRRDRNGDGWVQPGEMQ